MLSLEFDDDKNEAPAKLEKVCNRVGNDRDNNFGRSRGLYKAFYGV